MTHFTWEKAAPGLYYLYEGPNRQNVGKVWRTPKGYDGRFGREHIGLHITGRTTPLGRIAALETTIKAFIHDATFSRKNF